MHPDYPAGNDTKILARIVAFLLALAGLSFLGLEPANAVQFKADQAVPDTMAQRLLACTGCHGPQGRAGPDGYYPRIAGKPAAYLYQQLLNFRDGRRHYEPMRRLLLPLSDRYLFEIAEYFSALELPYPSPSPVAISPNQLARARLLINEGDPALGVPACSSCHGRKLTGVEPGVPGLLGLPRDYINAQLGAWRNRQRHTASPDCMAQVAGKLGLEDVSSLSAWLVSQPLPQDTRPEPARSAIPVTTARPGAAPAPIIECHQSERPAGSAHSVTSRGEYLARIGNCAGCHTPAAGGPFEGGRAVDTPFGVVYSSNLTPDQQHGIGRWTKDEFWNAMKTGKSRDGRLLSPAFPYPDYSRLKREDSDALFDWLQSQRAIAKANRPADLRWPYNTRIALWVWRALFFRPEEFNEDRSRSAAWNRGAYLVQGLGHCGACHTPRNRWGASDSSRPLAGAMMPTGSWYAPSLLGDSEASLKAMSVEDASTFLQTGHSAQAVMLGPMAEVVVSSLQYLTRQDAVSIASYLADLPDVPRSQPQQQSAQQQSGASLYERHCADCHGENGEGRRDAENRPVYSKLAGNRSVTMKNTSNLVNYVLHGNFGAASQHSPKPYGMPPFQLTLDDAQIASVLTYLRNSWGNSAAGVQETEVSRQRGSASQ